MDQKMKKSPLQYALDLITMRDRTKNEISKKMAEKGYLSEEITKTIDWLKDKQFIDDEKFTEHYIKNQLSIGRSGRYKIYFKLIRLGIAPELAKKYLDQDDPDSEYERVKELAESWLLKKSTVEKKYEKLGRFLIGRGFNIDTVKKVLDEVLK